MPTRSSLPLIIAIPRGCWPLPVSENKTPVFLQSILYAFLFPGHRGGERERKYLTKHLTFLSPLSSLFPLSLGTESLSELLFQPPSLTPHPDYYAFINFDSLCYWYTSHVTSPWKSGNSWPQEACGPQFRSLISSSLEKKKKTSASLVLFCRWFRLMMGKHLSHVYWIWMNRATTELQCLVTSCQFS